MTAVRVVTAYDAPTLIALLRTDRAFLAPFEPERDDDFFTEAHQRELITTALARHAQGVVVPCVIVHDGVVVGRITISDIVRGPFQNGHLGYWVSQSHTGRGVATAAVAAVVRLAFGDLGLHRLQAGTLVHNTASQRVLAKNGFTRIGTAARYLRIAGRWQDHVLHQLLADQPG